MKKHIIFVILKIVELSTVIFGPYYLGVVLLKWSWFVNFVGISTMSPYFVSLYTLILLSITCVSISGCCSLLYLFWNINKKWARIFNNKLDSFLEKEK